MTTALKPVKLQANVAGAWKTIATFDAADDAAAAKVQEGAQLLHDASPNTAYRIAMIDGRSPTVLRQISKSTYGIWMDARYTDP